MLGAIAGDVIGSVYEGFPIKQTNFPLFDPRATFTDDTVLTVAIAFSIINPEVGYADALKLFGRKYPHAGYGGNFRRWLLAEESKPYNSWGNGSAMRVSPVGWAFDTRKQVLAEAEKTAAVSHNHPEGIKGAQAIALAVYLARNNTPWTTSGPVTASTSRARALFPRPWSPSLTVTASKKPSASPSPSAATATPWPVWPVPSPTPTTAASPNPSLPNSAAACPPTYSTS